jgi:hypothetical protein
LNRKRPQEESAIGSGARVLGCVELDFLDKTSN